MFEHRKFPSISIWNSSKGTSIKKLVLTSLFCHILILAHWPTVLPAKIKRGKSESISSSPRKSFYFLATLTKDKSEKCEECREYDLGTYKNYLKKASVSNTALNH